MSSYCPVRGVHSFISPKSLIHHVSSNPDKVLLNIEPLNIAIKKGVNEQDMIPVVFNDRGKIYMGWQKKEVMSMLLEINVNENEWLEKPRVRCPNCETLYNITTEQLLVAKGKVRCGRCSTVFDAYQSLPE